MAGLIRYRAEFLEVTKRPMLEDGTVDRAASAIPHSGIDVLRSCMTVAKACMTHFRTNHLKRNHLALVPEKGYGSAETQR